MVPFLKWAGGKRWLFTPEFVKSLPRFERYIEPFLGGGAGFFAIEPGAAILADLNPELIELYEIVRDSPSELRNGILNHQHEHSKDYYYAVRSQIPTNKIDRAARTLYLNRTCWNGLYRRNLKGEFNVPIGTKSKVILETDDFEYASKLLSNAKLLESDFGKTIGMAKEGDLIFADPPYTTAHNFNGFVKYNESIFSWHDQIRLSHSLQKAVDRGAKIVSTNAYHESVLNLYRNFGEASELFRQTVIAAKAKDRKSTSELLLIGG